MARIRSIKPDFFLDEELSDLSLAHRLLFIGLWTQADREGRLEDRPRRLRAALFPYDDIDVDALLSDLANPRGPKGKSFIVRYCAESQPYIQICNFSRHQRPHHTEIDSTIPPFNGGIPVISTSINGELPDGREGKGEGNRKGKEKEIGRERNTPALRADAEITLDHIELLRGQYPSLNVNEELENCQVYWMNEVKPVSRRGPPNIRKFRNWLKKAQEYQEERNGRAKDSNGRREAGAPRSPSGEGSLLPVDWGITSDEVG